MELLIGAGIFLAGAIFGRIHRPRKEPPKLRPPTCSCEHARSFHVNGTGACMYKMYDSRINHTMTCTCQVYDGPIPLSPSYFAPEVDGN